MGGGQCGVEASARANHELDIVYDHHPQIRRLGRPAERSVEDGVLGEA